MNQIPEVWIVRLVGVAGLSWCLTNFRRARRLPNGRPSGRMWTTSTYVNSAIGAVAFLAMLVASFW